MCDEGNGKQVQNSRGYKYYLDECNAKSVGISRVMCPTCQQEKVKKEENTHKKYSFLPEKEATGSECFPIPYNLRRVLSLWFSSSLSFSLGGKTRCTGSTLMMQL